MESQSRIRRLIPNGTIGKTRAKSDARQRIVETAERLFYSEGVRAVGIDRIIAESEVTELGKFLPSNHFWKSPRREPLRRGY